MARLALFAFLPLLTTGCFLWPFGSDDATDTVYIDYSGDSGDSGVDQGFDWSSATFESGSYTTTFRFPDGTSCNITMSMVYVPSAPVAPCTGCTFTTKVDLLARQNSCDLVSADDVFGVNLGLNTSSGTVYVQMGGGWEPWWGGVVGDGTFEGSSDWYAVDSNGVEGRDIATFRAR